MQTMKSKTRHFCSHPAYVAKYGQPVEITQEACNRCNDAVITKTGYCCDYMSCERTCNRRGNPDLCNYFREPEDAFSMDNTEVPLTWDPDCQDKDKMADKIKNPRRWKREPKSIKDVKKYGRYWPAKFHSERMQTKKKKHE